MLVKELTSLLKIGAISVDDFWDRVEGSTKAKVPLDKWDIWAKSPELQPQTSIINFTQELKQKGYKVAILSNTFPNTAADIEAHGWYKPYSPVFLSSSVGLAKPDAAFYEYALEKLENKASEVIFIDDQQKCLDPAQSLGMSTVLAKDAQQIINDVSQLISKNAEIESLF